MFDLSIFVENELVIKAVVVENETRTLDIINQTMDIYNPNVDIVAQANDMKSGICIINEFEPDLLLINIRLKDGSGFELIDHFNPPDFKTIFFSNHIDYAIKAIKYDAIDYLLKPIVKESLAQAIKKADSLIRYEEKLQAKALGTSFNILKDNHRILLKSSDRVHLVNSSDIIHLEAGGNYSNFYMKSGRKIMVSKSTKEYEEVLFDQGFYRVHKSHIININQMRYFDKTDGGTLVMTNGDKVPVASRKKEMLMELFDNLTK